MAVCTQRTLLLPGCRIMCIYRLLADNQQCCWVGLGMDMRAGSWSPLWNCHWLGLGLGCLCTTLGTENIAPADRISSQKLRSLSRLCSGPQSLTEHRRWLQVYPSPFTRIFCVRGDDSESWYQRFHNLPQSGIDLCRV